MDCTPRRQRRATVSDAPSPQKNEDSRLRRSDRKRPCHEVDEETGSNLSLSKVARRSLDDVEHLLVVQGAGPAKAVEFELQRNVYRVRDDAAFEKVVTKGAELYGQPRATLANFRRSQVAGAPEAAPSAGDLESTAATPPWSSPCQAAPSTPPLRGQALLRAWRLAKSGFLDANQVKRSRAQEGSRTQAPEERSRGCDTDESRVFVVGEESTKGGLEVVSEGKVYAVRDVQAFARTVIQSVPAGTLPVQGVASTQTVSSRCTNVVSSLVSCSSADDGRAPRRTLRDLIRAQRVAAAVEDRPQQKALAGLAAASTCESFEEPGLWDSQWTTVDQERREALGRAWRLAKEVR